MPPCARTEQNSANKGAFSMTPIVFGTSCLGNLYKEISFDTKVAIAAEWFKAYPHPTIDSAGKYGAGLSLECIGKALKALGL